MSMQDTVADMLTRVRNAQMAGHLSVQMPSSKLKVKIAELLKAEGYVQGFDVVVDGVKNTLTLVLKYFDGKPVIESIKRVSKPGLRVYRSVDDLPTVNGGLGVAIVSTSKGIMTGKDAKKAGCGGEVLAIVA